MGEFMHYSVLWFLFGLGSQLQIVASLSITELCVYALAPFLYLIERPHMRQTGVLRFFHLSLLVVVGCMVACWQNHTPFESALRGMAVTCLLPCVIVVGHHLLRKDMSGFKWMLVGVTLSIFACTFWFQKSVELAKVDVGSGNTADAAKIMSGPIYWIGRLGELVNLPSRGWYLRCPLLYSVCAPLFLVVFSMLSSTSGRSAALCALSATIMVLLGGRHPVGIRKRICCHFWRLVLIAMLCIWGAKESYSYLARRGALGEDAQKKYEGQTHGSDSMMRLLLGGRMESFCGLMACVDNPIVGFGPWAMDTRGYRRSFLAKYGTPEDFEAMLKTEAWVRRFGMEPVGLIPCHSHITSFWLYYGISGLVFWLYVLFVFVRYLKEDCWAIPHWYFWVAAGIPGYVFVILFSPFSDRIGLVMVTLACLFARAVRRGFIAIPAQMAHEIAKL